MTRARCPFLVVSVVCFVIGCGGSDTSPLPTNSVSVPPPPLMWHINGAINDNHGHKVTLNWGQIETGGTVSLPFHGHPTHSHLATLGPEELQRIADGERLVTTCSPGGEHTHVVMFSWPDNIEEGTPLKTGGGWFAPS